jgi:hypothetical protein
MTPGAKLLIVVVFILSLIFAAMSAVLFGKREDYRAELQNAKRDFAVKEDKLTTDNAKLTAERDAANRDAAEAKANADATQLRLDTLVHERERLDADMRAKEIESQKDKNLNLEQAAALDSLGAQVKSLLASEGTLKTDNDTLTTKLYEEQKRSTQLERENRDLDASLKTATASLSKAEETLKLNDDIFAELSRRNVAWREMISSWVTLPDIKARVVRVDPQTNFILLNAGEKQGVKKNYTFSIFRGGDFVAKVMVFDVQDDLCAARVVVSTKLAIERGDNAWTRLAD